MSLVRGRDFADADSAGAPRVAIVSESLARALYPDQDALGRLTDIRQDGPHRIIGVVADVRQDSLEQRSADQLYLPYAQGYAAGSTLVVRSSAPQPTLLTSVRAELARVSSDLIVTETRPVEAIVDRAASPRRFLVAVLGGFAGFALLLASVGIYAVVSFGVGQRTQEFGVRMALGATSAGIRRDVLGRTMRLAVTGLVLGEGAALLIDRFLTSLLYETSPVDPATFAGTAILLLAVAALAGFVPAQRAARLSPMRALQG
jgi:ABC-type antimicrobial peptide transport system permease subunit